MALFYKLPLTGFQFQNKTKKSTLKPSFPIPLLRNLFQSKKFVYYSKKCFTMAKAISPYWMENSG